MNISMIPTNDVKTIHASQGDSERVWHFVPYANGVIDTSQDELASINSIRGNTLVWNQLVTGVRDSVSGSGTTITKTGDYSLTIVGDRTVTLDVLLSAENVTYIASHKYLFLLGKQPQPIRVGFQNGISFTLPTGAEGAIVSPTTSSTARIAINLVAGTSYNLNITLNIFDLTLMFGSGNEPTTVDGFTSLFPLNYQYDSGSLLSFNGTGIKTVGKNLLKTYSLVPMTWSPILTKNEDGSIYVQGSRTSNGAYAIGTITLLANKTYTLKKTGSSDFYFQLVYEGGTLITGGLTDGTYTPTQNIDCTVRVFARANINYDFTVYPQIEFGSTSCDYEPYTENTTTLPIQTYFPTGMKSAGTVYDELTPTKAITRVGLITLNGSEAWAKANVTNPNGNCFELNYSVPFKGWGSGGRDSAVSNLFTKASSVGDQQTEANNTFWWNNARTGLRVVCSASTADEFKALLQSTPLQIQGELATPSEQDISEDLTYPVYVDGTEELLPVNGTSPSTAPMDANIQYPDEAKDVYFTYKQSEFESQAITGSMVCKGLEIEGETDENGITIQSTSELTSEAGFFDCKLKLTQGDDVCYSSKFQLHVEKRP